ncbi:MAG: SufD family Fe-S cluster assembly protein, partial [Brevinema sp.]
HHKTYIHVGKDRSVRLYVHVLSQENSLMIPQIYLDAQDNSHIELVYVADKAHNKGLLSPFFEMISQENAHTSFQTLCSGLDYQRLAFMGYVKGSASHIDLRTGFYLQKQERCDLYVRIFHHGADSTSNQIIKAVTLDESQMNFNAQIYASPQAQNIYAYQKLTGMLLGEKSQIFARPQLDIEYYELACSHGVSIGGFDPEELFYAQSRGIPAKDIYPLLLYGFFGEPFVDLPLEDYWVSQVKNTLGVNFV